MINYDISVELCGERTTYTDIVFTSGDMFAYRLNFAFTQNGAPVDVSDYTFIIKAKRQDGVIITDSGKTKNGLAYVDIKNSMIALSGEVSFEIALSGASGSYITTKELIAHVREGHGDGGISAEDTAPVLSSLLIAASEIKSTANDTKAIANDAKTVANDAKTLASEAKTMAFNTYDRESIDDFMDSKADKSTVYTKSETEDKLKEIGTKQIIPITIEEDENGNFSVTQTPSIENTIDFKDAILKLTIPPYNVAYSSSLNIDIENGYYFWTVFYDDADIVRILTIGYNGAFWNVWEDKLLSQTDLDTATENAKPYIASIELTENESGGFDVLNPPTNILDVGYAIEQGRDVILKANIVLLAGGKPTVYSSSMTKNMGMLYWTILYNDASKLRILKIRTDSGSTYDIQVFEEDIVSQADLDEAIGDIEASLDSIITKYGLGGDAV